MNLQGKVKTMQKIEKLMGFVSLFIDIIQKL